MSFSRLQQRTVSLKIEPVASNFLDTVRTRRFTSIIGFIRSIILNPPTQRVVNDDHWQGRIQGGALGLGPLNTLLPMVIIYDPLGRWIHYYASNKTYDAGKASGSYSI